MRRLWRRFLALDAEERALLARAAGTLVLTRAALWLLPLGTVRRLLDTNPRAPGQHDPNTIAWAIAAAARRLPWMTCLVEALTAQRMLKQAGLTSELRIGMRRGTASPIEAHAWVLCDGQVVIGANSTLPEYVVLSPTGAVQ